MKKNHPLLRLFAAFFKIGLFTFGGGYAMIPLIHREAVETHQWISDEEMLDVLAISEATPGPVSINSATFIGYRVAGFWGAASATLGVALPSFLIIAVLSLFIMQYQRFTWLTWVFDGIRAGVVVLILNAVIKLGKQVPRTNFVAIVIVLLGSIFGSQLPLTVTQMLWVNLIMDTFAALALASLPPSRSVMREKPRKNNDFIITRPMIRSIVGLGIVFVAALLGMLAWFGQGITPYELSVFFTVFVMLQFWNMFNAKGFGSRSTVCTHMKGCSAFYGVLLLILVGQIAIVTWGGDVFRTVPITLRDWAIIVGGTSLVMWAGELSRWIKRRQRA